MQSEFFIVLTIAALAVCLCVALAVVYGLAAASQSQSRLFARMAETAQEQLLCDRGAGGEIERLKVRAEAAPDVPRPVRLGAPIETDDGETVWMDAGDGGRGPN